MRRKVGRNVAVGLFVSVAVIPVELSAAPTTPLVIVQGSPQQLIAKYEKALTEERFADALALSQDIQVGADNKHGQAMIDVMRASALLGLKRDAEAQKLIAEADELAPDLSEPSSTLFFGTLVAKDFTLAAQTLDHMIARYPEAVTGMDRHLMAFFLYNEPNEQKQQNDRRRVALVRLGYGGDTETGHYMASDAVTRMAGDGDFKTASELLPHVKEPVLIENMLVEKRFSPMWPQLEQFAGQHLAKVRADSVAAAERVYDAAPDDHQALANYINALRHAGRLDDAIALRSKLPKTSAEMALADEGTGWAVNNVAYALHEAGRKDETDKLFELLNDAPMADESWRVSMKINRIEMLVQDGEFDKALPLIEPTAETKGSPFADQLTRGLRYCTLVRLGRNAEADKFLPEFLAHASDAPGATVDTLLCAGAFDRAEKVALTAIASPDSDKHAQFERDFLRSMQRQPLTSDDPSVWHGRWAEFRKRPAIAAAFDRLGRDMPDEFLTQSGH